VTYYISVIRSVIEYMQLCMRGGAVITSFRAVAGNPATPEARRALRVHSW